MTLAESRLSISATGVVGIVRAEIQNGDIEVARRGLRLHKIFATNIRRKSDGFLGEEMRRWGRAEINGNMIVTDSNGRSCFLTAKGDGLEGEVLLERKTGQEREGDRLQVVITRLVLEQGYQIDRAVIIYNKEQKEVCFEGKRQDLIDLVVSTAVIRQANEKRKKTRKAEKANYNQKSFWGDTKQRRRDYKKEQSSVMVEERRRLDNLTNLVLPEITVTRIR